MNRINEPVSERHAFKTPLGYIRWTLLDLLPCTSSSKSLVSGQNVTHSYLDPTRATPSVQRSDVRSNLIPTLRRAPLSKNLHDHSHKFSAWVAVDGVVAPEFRIKTSLKRKTVTCWIPSELGKKLSVHWKNISYHGDAEGCLEMDGKYCGITQLLKDYVGDDVEEIGIYDGLTGKPFTFSSVRLTDNDDFLGDTTHAKLGTVEITIYPIDSATDYSNGSGSDSDYSLKAKSSHRKQLLKSKNRKRKNAATQQRTTGSDSDSESEPKLKRESPGGEGKQAILAEPEPLRVAKVERWMEKNKRTDVAPIVTFIFKYRPLDVLQANGIAPAPAGLKRKASPAPARATSPPDKALQEEARALREKLKAVEALLERNDTKPRIKAEVTTAKKEGKAGAGGDGEFWFS
ncbi:hypothetical protein C8R47DRAFT_1226079 [Mycena vitilis]|nr:hypothetical protein C8R47DRAFT_1226079 [Mycena vitilis]